jgi:hypothetical protein
MYAVLLLTVFFFAVLMFLPAENYLDDVGQRFTMEGVGHPEGGGH